MGSVLCDKLECVTQFREDVGQNAPQQLEFRRTGRRLFIHDELYRSTVRLRGGNDGRRPHDTTPMGML